jgi:hypothetical protein
LTSSAQYFMTEKLLYRGLKPKNPVWMLRVAKAAVHFLC